MQSFWRTDIDNYMAYEYECELRTAKKKTDRYKNDMCSHLPVITKENNNFNARDKIIPSNLKMFF